MTSISIRELPGMPAAGARWWNRGMSPTRSDRPRSSGLVFQVVEKDADLPGILQHEPASVRFLEISPARRVCDPRWAGLVNPDARRNSILPRRTGAREIAGLRRDRATLSHLGCARRLGASAAPAAAAPQWRCSSQTGLDFFSMICPKKSFLAARNGLMGQLTTLQSRGRGGEVKRAAGNGSR